MDNRMDLVVAYWMQMDVGADVESLRITPELLKRIAEIDEFKGAWRAIGRIAPERLSALRRVATIESIGSSTRIEGAKLSDREIERLLGDLEITTLDTRDEQEVAGYAEVMETVFSSWEAMSLTENHILQLHRDLRQYSSKDERHRGAYKTLPNDVAAFDAEGKAVGLVFETAAPFDTPRPMRGLVEWTRETLRTRETHPLIAIAIFVVSFLAIHPFQDGNGRLSRILTTLLLLRAGYAYVPYSSLERVIEQHKQAYYVALRQTQKTLGANEVWDPWIEYFLSVLAEQKSRLEKTITRERVVLGSLPELSVEILELCRERGRISIADIVKVTGTSRNTIKDHVSTLTEKGHLTRHGAGRGTWYALS